MELSQPLSRTFDLEPYYQTHLAERRCLPSEFIVQRRQRVVGAGFNAMGWN